MLVSVDKIGSSLTIGLTILSMLILFCESFAASSVGRYLNQYTPDFIELGVGRVSRAFS